jgi:RimJ/RimL family protein N-acetyltransferase
MLNGKYPKTVKVNGSVFAFRLMEPSDRNAVLTFAQHLSESDLSFMRRDITQPDAVEDWIHDIQADRAVTILAEEAGKIVGYGTLYHNQLYWNRHLAELRVLVSSPYRNRGLGQQIATDLVMLSKKLKVEKVLAYLPVENKGAQRMVENLGFKPEAILADWVKTRDNANHDLLIMSMTLHL